MEFDKFALHAFNCLFYNYKISKLLPTNILLDFLKYHIPEKMLRKINIKAL